MEKIRERMGTFSVSWHMIDEDKLLQKKKIKERKLILIPSNIVAFYALALSNLAKSL